jgi:hypothetical protein
MPADGIVEDQHFLDVADYVGGLKARLDKLASATSALVKHAQLTGSVLMEFARVVVDLDETEAKAKGRVRHTRGCAVDRRGEAVCVDRRVPRWRKPPR